MNNPNDKEFIDDVGDCLFDRYPELKDRSVTIRLRAEEMELIKWALDDYEALPIREAVSEMISELCNGVMRDTTQDDMHSEINRAFSKIAYRKKLIKHIIFKIEEALEIEAKREQSEPGFDFGQNGKHP